VRDGSPLPRGDYADDVSWTGGGFTAMARPERVAAAFEAGATIVLQALHLHWLPAARYCRELEQALGFPAQANAYLTPASAQGFAVHHDVHDVAVLQVAGRKRWRIFPPRLELPLKHQRWSAALGDPGPPREELLLEPGDTLYLPRGWPHDAATGDGESLHLTIGLHPPTRLDALRAALDACAASDVELRRAALDGDGVSDELLARVAARLTPDAVAARQRRDFVMSRRPILEDQLDQLPRLAELTPETLVERRRTVIADLDDGPVLRFEGKTVAFPAHTAPELEALHAATAPVRPADLPGSLDAAGRLVLIRRLVREGYLRLV
jgi:hypothetical protein